MSAIETRGLVPLPRGVRQTAVGMVLPLEIDRKAWQAIGERLGKFTNASAWWIGDWLIHGDWAWGVKYDEGEQLTSLAYQTLRNFASVCERFELSRRRDNLSFGHHEAVAALSDSEQDRWLDSAAPAAGETKPRLSVMALREAIATPRRLPAPSIGSVPVRITISEVAPDRAERWRTAAETAGVDFAEWAADALDRAAA